MATQRIATWQIDSCCTFSQYSSIYLIELYSGVLITLMEAMRGCLLFKIALTMVSTADAGGLTRYEGTLAGGPSNPGSREVGHSVLLRAVRK